MDSSTATLAGTHLASEGGHGVLRRTRRASVRRRVLIMSHNLDRHRTDGAALGLSLKSSRPPSRFIHKRVHYSLCLSVSAKGH